MSAGTGWAVDLLLSDQFLKYSRQPELFRRECLYKIQNEGLSLVLLDEIQRIPQLLNEVHHLIETTKCRFILTGSSARKLRSGGVNLLAGRAVRRELFPFVYREIAGSMQLDEALRFGTLPGIYGRAQDEMADMLRTYAGTYLKEEVLAEGLVRNLGAFSRFLDVAAAQAGEQVSFSSIARECQVPVATVRNHYEILEDTRLGFRLEPWRQSVRRRLVAQPKFYFFDLGVLNGLLSQLTCSPDPVREGRLFEQFIVLETFRMRHYLQSESSLFFWRTNHGAEVDLVVEKHGRLTAGIEIKATAHVGGRHLTGLRSLADEYPGLPLLVVARVEHPYRLGQVEVLPWQRYLTEIERFL
jgi:predicted AAA+ superfamily ATPase